MGEETVGGRVLKLWVSMDSVSDSGTVIAPIPALRGEEDGAVFVTSTKVVAVSAEDFGPTAVVELGNWWGIKVRRDQGGQGGKEEETEALSQSSVALQGYVDAIQLMLVAAVPQLKEKVTPKELVVVVDSDNEGKVGNDPGVDESQASARADKATPLQNFK
ncbi:hypothetical protein Bca52824_010676 [Brassica carinata]|uniref:Uncharacterized protein n=1 Tax=Brassica carinata TaxID=52824 RepID=A0A8X7WBW8_BRACI|nr:hypothetical protein Bca52824_010676 [Brassica carinata]